MKRIEFYHVNWCPPCRNALNNIINPLKDKFGSLIEVIDCQNDPCRADKKKIDKLPLTILMDGTREIKRIVGIPNKEELERFLYDSNKSERRKSQYLN